MKISASTWRVSTVAFFLAASASLAGEPVNDVRAKIVGELRDAKKLLAHEKKPSPTALAEIVRAQVRLHDVEGALKTLALIPEEKSWYIYLSMASLAELQAQIGQGGDAFNTIDSVPNRLWWQPTSNAALLAVARAAKQSGRQAEAKKALDRAVKRTADSGDGDALYDLTIKLVEMGEWEFARRTQWQFELAIAKTKEDEATREDALCRVVILNAKLASRAAAKKILWDGYRAIDTRLPASGGAQRRLAAALAEVCDQADELPCTITWADLFTFHLAKNDLAGAAATAKQMPGEQEQADAFVAIGARYGRAGAIAEATTVLQNVKNESQRAIAMLDLATMAAKSGDKKKAREMAEGLTYPRSQWPFTERPIFKFSAQETWGVEYEFNGFFTMAWGPHMKETAGDLTAAAIRCQVALEGKAAIPSPQIVESWHVRRVARAQTDAGDAPGAFAWVDRLRGARRLEAMIGMADGLADWQEKGGRKG